MFFFIYIIKAGFVEVHLSILHCLLHLHPVPLVGGDLVSAVPVVLLPPSIHLVEHGQSAPWGQFQRGDVCAWGATGLVSGADTEDLGQPSGGEGFDEYVQGHLVGGAPGGQSGEHLAILHN